MPKGVKANMVEEQLKGMTPDPEKATKEQKAQAEETVEKDLRTLIFTLMTPQKSLFLTVLP